MAARFLSASRAASHLRISVFPRAFSTGLKLLSESQSNTFEYLVKKPLLLVKGLKYADTHEWVKVDGSSATIGIRPCSGKNFGAVESVKATSDVHSPVSGEVVEINSEPNSSPGLNFRLLEKTSGELNSSMDSEKYAKFCEEEVLSIKEIVRFYGLCRVWSFCCPTMQANSCTI